MRSYIACGLIQDRHTERIKREGEIGRERERERIKRERDRERERKDIYPCTVGILRDTSTRTQAQRHKHNTHTQIHTSTPKAATGKV